MPTEDRAPLDSDGVLQGRVLWLPSRLVVLGSSLERVKKEGKRVKPLKRGKAVNIDAYEHPILVVSRDADNPDNIDFLVLTSFGGKDVQTALLNDGNSNTSRKQSWHFPIHVTRWRDPVVSSVTSEEQLAQGLLFERRMIMPKRGYVDAKHVYTMDWRDVKPFLSSKNEGRQPFQLTPNSLAHLLALSEQLSGFVPGLQYHKDDPVMPDEETTEDEVSSTVPSEGTRVPVCPAPPNDTARTTIPSTTEGTTYADDDAPPAMFSKDFQSQTENTQQGLNAT